MSVISPRASTPTTGLFVLCTLALAGAAAIAIGVAYAGGDSLYTRIDRDVPGMATSITSTSLELIALLAGMLCTGAIVTTTFLRARRGKDRLLVDEGTELRVVRYSAAVWALSSAALIAVDAADSNGQPLAKLFQGALGYLFTASYAPGAWLAAAVCAFLVFLLSVFVQRWQTTVLMLGVALIGLLAPVVVGQVLVGPNHDFGSDATAFGLPAFAILAGATTVILGRMLAGATIGQVTMRRYLHTAAACWAVAVVCQLIVAAFELDGTGLFASSTGRMFGAWFALAAVLGILLLVMWRRRPTATTPRPASFLGAGAASILVLALMAGLDEAMSRVPPPQFFAPTSTMDLFFGYNVDQAPSVATLLADWRINILFFAPAVAAMALYAWGVVRLRRRGDGWPVGRTCTWMAGCLVVILTTSSALGPYASASFSAHMIFHMSLNMLGPLLLVMGGPVTLALRATQAHAPSQPAGPHEWINAMLHWSVTRKLYNPLLVFVEFVGSYYLIYFTGLYGWAMRYHWAHQLMNLHLLLVGYLFYGLVIGVDRLPRPLPYLGKLAMVLAAMPFHAFFGVIVMTSSSIIGSLFYTYIHVPWMHDLHQDQFLAGGIAWAAGELPLVVVVIALVTQWARQDKKTAQQIDRHLDAGLDDSFDAYNEILSKLAARSAIETSAIETGVVETGAIEAGVVESGATGDRGDERAP
jgi:cytochrome c oxidase assembly factor CtaG